MSARFAEIQRAEAEIARAAQVVSEQQAGCREAARSAVAAASAVCALAGTLADADAEARCARATEIGAALRAQTRACPGS